jgi:hypothetical protein
MINIIILTPLSMYVCLSVMCSWLDSLRREIGQFPHSGSAAAVGSSGTDINTEPDAVSSNVAYRN